MFASRRFIAAPLAAALVLAGCSTTPSPSKLALDANLIATGLQSVVTALAATPGVPQAVLAQVQGYVTILQRDAAAVSTATAADRVTTVQGIAKTVQDFANAVLPLSLPNGAQLSAVVQAAVSLVPVILAVAGVSAASQAAPMYSPAQARTILAAGAR